MRYLTIGTHMRLAALTMLAASASLPLSAQTAPSAPTVAIESGFTYCPRIVLNSGSMSESTLSTWGWTKLPDASNGSKRFKPRTPAVGDFEVFYSPSSKICTVSYFGADYAAIEQAGKSKATSLGHTRFNEQGMNATTAQIADSYMRSDTANGKRLVFTVGSNATNQSAAIAYYERALR